MERRQILRQEQVRKAVFNSSDQLKNCCSLPLIKVECEYKFPTNRKAISVLLLFFSEKNKGQLSTILGPVLFAFPSQETLFQKSVFPNI